MLEVRFADSKWVKCQYNYWSNFCTVSIKLEACKNTQLSHKTDQPFFPLGYRSGIIVIQSLFQKQINTGKKSQASLSLSSFQYIYVLSAVSFKMVLIVYPMMLPKRWFVCLYQYGNYHLTNVTWTMNPTKQYAIILLKHLIS